MINSRNIDDLHPYVAMLCHKFVLACAAAGIDILITSTYRDKESQDVLYAQGRTTKGQVVTHARGGFSYHQYKLAFDFCPIRDGKALWTNTDLFRQCGKIGESLGLEWAGRWHTMTEVAHLQATGGLTLADLQSGKTPAFPATV